MFSEISLRPNSDESRRALWSWFTTGMNTHYPFQSYSRQSALKSWVDSGIPIYQQGETEHSRQLLWNWFNGAFYFVQSTA
ncbi:unnamed protein product [Trichobilharzia szidati]|nr:unnamed protein product [Trichobilharzia szidati]